MGFFDRFRKQGPHIKLGVTQARLAALERALLRPSHLDARAQRDDGWANVITGLGQLGTDKRLNQTFAPDLIAQEDCEQLWRGDDIAARAVETVPDEMLREGYEVVIPEQKELSEAFEEEHKRLNVVEVCRQALQWARAFGGAGILLGLSDGARTLEEPVDLSKVQHLKFLTVWSPRELQPVTYYSNVLHPKYGYVSVYRLVPLYQPPGANVTNVLVHESRIIRIAGNETSRRARFVNSQPGWEDSIFVRMAQVVSDFQAAWQGVGILLQDFSVATLKMKGLSDVLAGQGSDELSVTARAKALELTRSIARVVILDADGEEWERHTTTVTGLADLLDKFMLRVAASVAMPVSLLFGQAPAGLNATGDSDIRWFYDQVAAQQHRKLLPVLTRITELLEASKEGPTRGKPVEVAHNFHPLWQPTDKEQAEGRNIQATADTAYINAQVLTPEEVAQSRFGGDVYSFQTHIDLEAREALKEADNPEESAKGENDVVEGKEGGEDAPDDH